MYIHHKKWETKLQITSNKQGVFQALRQYIATGFDSYSYDALALDKGHINGGNLILNNDDIRHIKSSMKQQTLRRLKFHASLVYLLELGYNVTVQPSLNVSSNPNFESCIGEFG